MNLNSKFAFSLIAKIAEPVNDLLIKNSNLIREYFFTNEYAAIFLSIFIAICIIKSDFLFIIMCLACYILIYILLWKYISH